MALDVGAAPYGNWSGCHATGWDRYAPEFGDVNVGDQFQKHSYLFGLLINAEGRRFVDEGRDFHSFTYAQYGGEVLKQPGQFAWQVFDSKVTKLLRSEYRIKFVTKESANSLEELAPKLEGVNAEQFLKTVREYNAAVKKDVPFDHTIKDGKGTVGISPAKSNWAQPLDTPPFDAYATTCGITFTFGGLRIAKETGQVLDVHFHPIPASTRRARWWAACSTSTTRAAPGSSPAPSSAASPATPPEELLKAETQRTQRTQRKT
jgi:tricarballylate dehydrogenase